MPFIINTDMNFMQPLPGPDTLDNQWKGSWVATRMFVHVDMATVNADTLPYQIGCCLFCNINVRSAGIALADPNASESKHGALCCCPVPVLDEYSISICSIPLLRPNVWTPDEPSAEVLRIPGCKTVDGTR